jgi:hypothetical protein
VSVGATPVSATSRVLAFATLGAGSNEEHRILTLLGGMRPEAFPFDRRRKLRMFWGLLRTLRATRPDLVVMEGTGVAGGAALIVARVLFGCRYVVSSGDAVGPWVATQSRFLAPVFGLYERVLCRLAAGFIGWTPYLVGRALTFGVPRAMTAPGWAPFVQTPEVRAADRARLRQELGIPAGNLVIGIAGTMHWSRRYRYCYGRELVEAARLVTRRDVTFLLVGDGSGRGKLEDLAAGLPAGLVRFVGRVPQDQLPAYYAAMDAGSLPQSVDRVGSFRYTTKLSEYLAHGLPVVIGQIPLAYDLDRGGFWRLPGHAPWDPRYTAALATWVESLTWDELALKRTTVAEHATDFDQARQAARTTEFIRDICAAP